MSDRSVSFILFAISLIAIFAAFAFYAAFYYTTSFLIHDSVNKTLLWSGIFDRQIQIRVEKNANRVAPAASSSTSTKPPITVISPNGGEVWRVGSTHTITWRSTDNVPIGSWVTLGVSGKFGIIDERINKLPPTGSYSWTIPTTFCAEHCGYQTAPSSDNYVVAVLWSPERKELAVDESDTSFSVVTATSTQQMNIDTSNWKTYRNEEYGLEIQLPPSFGFSISANPDAHLVASELAGKWRTVVTPTGTNLGDISLLINGLYSADPNIDAYTDGVCGGLAFSKFRNQYNEFVNSQPGDLFESLSETDYNSTSTFVYISNAGIKFVGGFPTCKFLTEGKKLPLIILTFYHDRQYRFSFSINAKDGDFSPVGCEEPIGICNGYPEARNNLQKVIRLTTALKLGAADVFYQEQYDTFMKILSTFKFIQI